MGLKSIEMQVALPRTQDAGKLQDDMMRQNQKFQETLTQSQLNKEKRLRKKVNTFEQVKEKRIKKDENDQSHHRENEEEQEQERNKKHSIEHPYLGNTIDFSG